ncbi:MAG: hypothetical protein PHH00_01010 [Candidatus Nanoarchaeia archaeon]|nr:hypothetical protein [Candidatus Nanoarchaeia archaeon]
MKKRGKENKSLNNLSPILGVILVSVVVAFLILAVRSNITGNTTFSTLCYNKNHIGNVKYEPCGRIDCYKATQRYVCTEYMWFLFNAWPMDGYRWETEGSCIKSLPASYKCKSSETCVIGVCKTCSCPSAISVNCGTTVAPLAGNTNKDTCGKARCPQNLQKGQECPGGSRCNTKNYRCESEVACPTASGTSCGQRAGGQSNGLGGTCPIVTGTSCSSGKRCISGGCKTCSYCSNIKGCGQCSDGFCEYDYGDYYNCI